MTPENYIQHLQNELQALQEQGLFKHERIITSSQSASINVLNQTKVLNFCANNYLGLASHPELIQAGQQALEKYGFGMASVRFICGTQNIHKQLEEKLSEFLGFEDTILYSSCFDANGGLFETLLTEKDAVISDSLNHASIIDGIRLCKAKRLRYHNNDMNDLEIQLKEAQSAQFKLIATDGVFSMDGTLAKLPEICDLAEKYRAMVMVDDSHAVGFMGNSGRGTHEHFKVMNRIDLMTGTLGKALGGASGGYISGRKEVISWLRNRSRPYLFSNSLAPVVAAVSLKVLELLTKNNTLRERLHEKSAYFRHQLQELGFSLIPGQHPIIPVMLGDAKLASQMAEQLLAENIYVVGFSYPVVPKGQARIRTQMSAGHSKEQLDLAIKAFAHVGRSLGIIQ
jgi:glycine C-acetyltransferase